MDLRERPVDLDDRSTFIGGSDAAFIVGWGKKGEDYPTATDLWRQKRGEAEVPDLGSKIIKRGRYLEPGLIQLAFDDLVEELGLKDVEMESIETNLRLQHPKVPFLAAEADCLVTWSTGERWIIEAKTAANRREWVQDEERHKWAMGDVAVPKHYYPQVVQQMAVFGAHKHYAIVNSPFTYDICRTDRLVDTETHLINDLADWWETHVIGGAPPPAEEYADVAKQFPQHLAHKEVDPDEHDMECLRRLVTVKKERKALGIEEEALKLRLAAKLEDAEEFRIPGAKKPLCTYRSGEREQVDLNALREAHPDLVAEFTATKTTRTLLTKDKVILPEEES